MNKRILERYFYYGIRVFCVAVLIVFVLNCLSESGKKEVIDIESELPKNQKEQLKTDSSIIRVVIKTDGFQEITHQEIQLKAEQGLVAAIGEEKKEYGAGELFCVKPNDPMFQEGTIQVTPKDSEDRIVVANLNRGYGIPSYRGSFELRATAEGIVLVNELELESYLYGVVPSEMPASYEMEALKAQAVCARSYAYNQMKGMSYPEYEAHVDDSTSFQVYGNSKEQDSVIRAVDATAGEKLWYNNQVATAYYYSTSSGKSTGIEAWGTTPAPDNAYLQSVDICNEEGIAYEKALAWYRWKASIPERLLTNLLEQNTKTEIGTLQSVSVTKQGAGGIALQLVAEGDKGSVTVDTENKIRRALGGEGYVIEKQDGTVADSRELLPSAFISIEKKNGTYEIHGGGYGHGIGMSQNGANEMAKAGKTYTDILNLFYQGISIK